MKDNKLVSVIVPMYNCFDVIKGLIFCLKSQSYHNIEILLIDDGSSDKTIEICRDAIITDKRFKLLSKPNGGVSSARNLGLDISKGEFITFIDADDLINECFIENLVNAISNADVAISLVKIVTRDGKELSHYDNYQDYQDEKIYMLNHWSVWGRLYRSKDLQNIRFDETIHIAEDLKFTVDYLCSFNGKCAFSYNSIYYYTTYNGSAMLSGYNKKFIGGLLTEVECFKRLEKYNVNLLCTSLIGNGAYQMLTRYFEQSRKKRKENAEDYLLVKKIVNENIHAIIHGNISIKKKIFNLLACKFPIAILTYKHFKFFKKRLKYEIIIKD